MVLGKMEKWEKNKGTREFIIKLNAFHWKGSL